MAFPDALSAVPDAPAGGSTLGGSTPTHTEHHQALADALNETQAALGTGVDGGSTVAARLSSLEADGPATATIVATRTTTSATSSFVAMPENIVKVGTTYWLLYSVATGTKTSLYLASSTSADGPWTSYGEVLTCGSLAWETAPFTNGGALLEHDGTFYLFYACDDTGGAIGVATASTVTGPYTKNADPLIEVGVSGWESRRVQEPDVRVAPDGTWVMAYMGEDLATAKGASEKIGIATAADPLGPWTKSAANPVIGFGDTGEWDEGGAADPSLFYENGVWWCLYSGLDAGGAKPWQLGLAYAYDLDGPWTRQQSNPILGPGGAGAFDANSVWRGAIYEENGVYHLPYGGIPASADSAQAKAGSAHVTGLGATSVTVDAISATGTRDDTTFLRGDGAWAVPPGVGGGGSVPTAWTTYTPSWTGSTSNPTLGTGGEIKGRYRRFGYNVEGRIELRIGTSAGAGGGLYYLSLPAGVTPAVPITGVSYAVGAGWIYSGTRAIPATLCVDSGDLTKFRVVVGATATVDGSVWASSNFTLTASGNLATFQFSLETQESAFGA